MSRRMIGLLALVACVVGSLPVAAETPLPPNVERSDPLTRSLIVTYRLMGRADRAAEDVTCYFFLPQDEPRQTVRDLRFLTEPAEVFTDAHGRRVARVAVPHIRPGEHRAVRWMARVTTYRTRHYLEPRGDGGPGDGSPPELAPEVRAMYLADRPPYGVRSPFIRKTAERLAPETLSDREAVQAVCDFLNEHVEYEMVNGWDTAETVIRRGTGSCSEFAYSFIALCRARGVPARYIGGLTWPEGVPLSFDDAHHRWSEVFLEGLGWVPLDFRASGYKGDGYYMMPPARLSLGHGDGDAKAPLGWKYTSEVKSRVPAHASSEYVWCRDTSDETFDRVYRIASGMRKAEPKDLDRAAEELVAIGEPIVAPFLADLVFDPDTDRALAAAKALCPISETAARRFRYRMRDRPDMYQAFTRGLARLHPDARRGRPGQWTDLFDGRRVAVPLAGEGPFRIEKVDGDTRLTNGGRTGQTLFDYRTGDRCLIDLEFTTRGVGRAALVFAHANRRTRLRLPFYLPEKKHRWHNRIRRISGCPRGTYGVEPDRPHRVLLLVDGCKVRVVLDGKRVLGVKGWRVAPGRVGLAAWGDETRLEVKRLRVFEGGKQTSPLDAMTEVLGGRPKAAAEDLFEPVTIDLSTDPLSGTTTGTGTLAISAPTMNGDPATYDVTLTMPVAFDEKYVFSVDPKLSP